MVEIERGKKKERKGAIRGAGERCGEKVKEGERRRPIECESRRYTPTWLWGIAITSRRGERKRRELSVDSAVVGPEFPSPSRDPKAAADDSVARSTPLK